VLYREAIKSDIPGIQFVRNAVKENMLSDPKLVSDADCEDFIMRRGKGWICEIDGTIVAFSIADLQDHNVWALFVHPAHDRKGIGRRLQEMMLDWYFTNTSQDIWLGTAPGTRAEEFYRKSGWREIGTHGKGEIKFLMKADDWIAARRAERNFQ
jgi:GNAT superfamily N-acetyltransferase